MNGIIYNGYMITAKMDGENWVAKVEGKGLWADIRASDLGDALTKARRLADMNEQARESEIAGEEDE